MKKKFAVMMILWALFFVSLNEIKADSFYTNSGYDVYEGGYVNGESGGSTGYHWTAYQLKGSGTTYASGVRVLSFGTEVAPARAYGRAYIQSVHLAGPYDCHTHYKYVY